MNASNINNVLLINNKYSMNYDNLSKKTISCEKFVLPPYNILGHLRKDQSVKRQHREPIQSPP